MVCRVKRVMLGKIIRIKGNFHRRIRVLRQTQNIITVNEKSAIKTRELCSVNLLGKRIHLPLPPLSRQDGHLLDIMNLRDLWEFSEQIP